MADISTVTVNLSPTIDTSALAASIRSAVADALEQVAGELRAEAPAGTRWTIGQTLTEAELNELPVGAVVKDRDGDPHTRTDAAGTDYAGNLRTWDRRFGSSTAVQARVSSQTVIGYQPVTLVSLP